MTEDPKPSCQPRQNDIAEKEAAADSHIRLTMKSQRQIIEEFIEFVTKSSFQRRGLLDVINGYPGRLKAMLDAFEERKEKQS